MSFVGGGFGVQASAFYVALPAEELLRCFKHVLALYFLFKLRNSERPCPNPHFVGESKGEGGLRAHVGRTDATNFRPCAETYF